MKRLMNVDLSLIFHTIRLILTLFFLFKPFAETYLEGTVVSAQSGLPLDSVRVASVLYGITTHTQKDGRFLLKPSDSKNCFPDTQIINSFNEYTVYLNHSDRRHAVITQERKPVTVAYLDLQGRVIAQTVLQQFSGPFPEQRLLPGIYIVDVPGMKPKRVLVTDNFSRGFLEKQQHSISRIIPCYCPIVDTIVFCKEGYTPFHGSINTISNRTSVARQKNGGLHATFTTIRCLPMEHSPKTNY
jgi:hypothetical protein